MRGVQPSVWVGRAVVLVSLLLALLAGVPAGYHPHLFVVVVIGLAALVSAFRPDHLVVSLTMAFLVVWWARDLHGEMPAVVLVVAGALVVAHVAATVLAYGPPTLPVDPRLALLWTARGALVWLTALLVWGVARTYSGHGTPTLFWLGGLGAALVGSVAAGIAMPVRGETAE
jgi:ABC-type dipeptide/oligopeptide/nickel transport system permease subunit